MVSGQPAKRATDRLCIEEIDAADIAMLRRLTPAERVERGLRMGAFARGVIEAGVRRGHPEWNDEQVRAETLRRFAGE